MYISMIPSSFTPTQKELSLADRILLKANALEDSEGLATAKLNAESAVEIFLGTKLSPQVLSSVWNEADVGEKGYLIRSEVCVALRLIGWAQSGEDALNHSLLGKASPLAVVAGFDSKLSVKDSSPSSSKTTLSPNAATVEDLAHFKKLPQSPQAPDPPPSRIISPRAPITRADLEGWNVPSPFISHSQKLFDAADKSQQGYLDENEASSLFRKAKLSDEQLSRIWDLIGAEHSGRCTKDNFVGVMFLVYRSIAGLEIPDLLPESFSNAYSSRPETTDPFSNPDHEVVSSSPNPDQEDEVEKLYRQIHALEEALLMVDRENEDLRSSVQTMHRISRQQTMSHNRMSRNVDTSSIELARLQADLQDKDNTLARLRASVRVNEDLSRENTIFRLQIEELTSRLEVSHGDAAAQKLVAEELLRETERLGQQLDELRETSSHVPTVTGDEELQNLINEDLSRENRRLRSKVRELQESFVQLRQPGEELDTLKESARALTRDNQRLHRRVRELEGASAAQDELRRRIEELNTENERMRRDLEQTRRRPPRQNTADAPPPAYEAISR